MKQTSIIKQVLKGRLSTNEILGGQVIPPLDRLRIISEDDFEDLVVEWAADFLSNKYSKVMRLGGSGDKGRDVICYYKDKTIDIYQCKHYAQTLAPSSMWSEFGKLCYYTFNKDYQVPKNYVIVTSRGVGQKLNDYIDNPTTINDELINQWADKCQNKITSSEIELDDKLKAYIKSFDFSIISAKPPISLIEEHKKTTYYATRFGGGLIKYRNLIPKPTKTIHKRELNYTNQLLQVYSEKSGSTITDHKTMATIDPTLEEHFESEREAFYCAESLDRFSRDNFADREVPPFDEIKEESKSLVVTCLNLCPHPDGFNRLESSKLEMMRQQFSSSPLHKEIKNYDKIGLCHYLANENLVRWIK
jgi:hypothetical protein